MITTPLSELLGQTLVSVKNCVDARVYEEDNPRIQLREFFIVENNMIVPPRANFVGTIQLFDIIHHIFVDGNL